MTLKVKFANFELISRSRTVAGLIGSRGELELVTSNLLKTIFPTKKAARLLGVSISGFVDGRVPGSDFSALTATASVRYFGAAGFIFQRRPSKRIAEWRMFS